MQDPIPITALGFIAVMLLLSTCRVWVFMVLFLPCSIHSREYCKDKNILKEAASILLANRFSCLGNGWKILRNITSNYFRLD